MDKQMIEEMATETARIVLSCPLNQGRNCGCCKFNDKDTISYDCQSYLVAEELYNAGYRKIPENAVVLEKTVYDKLLILADECIDWRRKNCNVAETHKENSVVLTEEEYERWQGQTLNIKKVRKETAEKFAVLRKFIIEQFHHYHEIRDKAERDCKKYNDELTKLVFNNDWHRADAIMFILERVGIEFDEIVDKITEG